MDSDLLTTGDIAARLKISMSSALRLMQSDAFEVLDVSAPGSSRMAYRVRVCVFETWVRSRTHPNGSS